MRVLQVRAGARPGEAGGPGAAASAQAGNPLGRVLFAHRGPRVSVDRRAGYPNMPARGPEVYGPVPGGSDRDAEGRSAIVKRAQRRAASRARALLTGDEPGR